MAVRKTAKGASLKRWFKEKWTDQDGNPCGSKKGDKVKKCRPSKRVSSKTPVSWSQIGPNKKKNLVAEKKRVGMGRKTKNL
tara:strand:+ start:2079 stop:2321 length:243 start_codon:yes stop_codon:yes gene_type:complete